MTAAKVHSIYLWVIHGDFLFQLLLFFCSHERNKSYTCVFISCCVFNRMLTCMANIVPLLSRYRFISVFSEREGAVQAKDGL